MAKVYSAPKEISSPVFDYENYDQSQANEKQYVDRVKEFARKTSSDKIYAGEEIAIPHADGKAVYIVLTSKPVVLIHLEIGDCWDAPLAHRLLTKDIVQMVASGKQFAKLFGRKA